MNGTGMLQARDLPTGDIDTVIIAGIDMYGRLTGKRVPVRRFAQVCAEGLHVCTCVYAWDFAQHLGTLKVDYAGEHTGWHDFRLLPDITTLRSASWLPRTAIVLADSVDEHTGDLVPIAPRTILRRTVESLTNSGWSPSAATELEFHLYLGTPAQLRAEGYRNLRPTTDVRADYNIIEGDLYDAFFAQIRTALEGAGVPVEVSQVEYGLGQWEINLEHGAPLAIADRHVMFKHIVRYLAVVNGMTATFMPRPVTDGMGSSCHVHASLQNLDGEPVFHSANAERGDSPVLLSAVAGVLDLIPHFMLWYAPTVNSMRRMLTQDFAGNGLTWGYDNRTTTCRVITGSPSATRLEMRLPGADANPYLTLSAVLGSIGDGIVRQADPGPAATGDAYSRSSATLLPRTLGDAAKAFRASSTAAAMFGSDVVDHYADVAEHEWSVFLQAVTDWDRLRYFDSI
jgi:glutamine synthetase